MMIREPVVAGQFYAGQPDKCLQEVRECVNAAESIADPPATIYGGVVPHAGWICSGAVAAGVLQAIRQSRQPKTFVILGAVHSMMSGSAAIFPSGQWETPLGRIDVDDRLAERVLAQTNLISPDPHAHEHEHSIEVQVPFIQHLFDGAKILPIMIPPGPKAGDVGAAVGRTIAAYNADAVVLASTDLTHYGPRYGFTPHGEGLDGLKWAKEVNDRRFIELIEQMEVDRIVPEAAGHHNACGSGAVAGAMAACRVLGATQAQVVQHTTSHETLGKMFPGETSDSVGYLGAVFC